MARNLKRIYFTRRNDVDMTQGSITQHIISFAFPLLLGNVFQQLYNMVDTWVVGNYVSNEAFSAVGTVGPIINMLIGAFMGLSSGAGVVISQYYGAKREDDVSRAVHTSIVMTLILGIAFTFKTADLMPKLVKKLLHRLGLILIYLAAKGVKSKDHCQIHQFLC